MRVRAPSLPVDGGWSSGQLNPRKKQREACTPPPTPSRCTCREKVCSVSRGVGVGTHSYFGFQYAKTKIVTTAVASSLSLSLCLSVCISAVTVVYYDTCRSKVRGNPFGPTSLPSPDQLHGQVGEVESGAAGCQHNDAGVGGRLAQARRHQRGRQVCGMEMLVLL